MGKKMKKLDQITDAHFRELEELAKLLTHNHKLNRYIGCRPSSPRYATYSCILASTRLGIKFQAAFSTL